MQTHVYVCIFLIWTSNHATIILCVYVRFTFKWNVDCMDCILMMWGVRFADFRHRVCQVYIYIYISTIVLGLKSRVVTLILLHLITSKKKKLYALTLLPSLLGIIVFFPTLFSMWNGWNAPRAPFLFTYVTGIFLGKIKPTK